MSDRNSSLNNEDINLEKQNKKSSFPINNSQTNPDISTSPKWINNRGEEVKQVFGFNENAELVNARVAMIGFLMLILTELAFSGEPATQKIFGIN
tara:strand:+ start:87 stop:371 length:285 start_codon:yes stop_codon:yes gene_type:complete